MGKTLKASMNCGGMWSTLLANEITAHTAPFGLRLPIALAIWTVVTDAYPPWPSARDVFIGNGITINGLTGAERDGTDI